MANGRLSMRSTKEILRLKHEVGLKNRQIARSLKISHTTVQKYLDEAEVAGVSWPLSEGDESLLEDMLYQAKRQEGKPERGLPEMSYIHRELSRKSVTLYLLWEEYREAHPEGYGYTQFCEYYKRWRSHLEPALRQRYCAGEKVFVDWAGQTIPVIDQAAGQVNQAVLFVGAMGASNYTFAEAFENRQLASWLDAHVHMYEFFGGVTEITVPDNEKTGVTKACRYEPKLHESYRDLAKHYGTVIIPARPREPQDKSKVETAVQNAERRILAALRNRTFFSIGELNEAIREELQKLNNRPFQKMDGSRSRLFDELDRPALKPLPTTRYEKSEWKKAKVNIDYHVQVDWHNYSVPYKYIHQTVDVRMTRQMIEVLCQDKRIAAHRRSYKKGGFTTDSAHMPKSHQKHTGWSPARLISWAEGDVGEYAGKVVNQIMKDKPHPEMGYRSCLGLMRLGKVYGKDRLEAACRRAWLLEVSSYQSIKSMLSTGMDTQPVPNAAMPESPVVHKNLRGPIYYN